MKSDTEMQRDIQNALWGMSSGNAEKINVQVLDGLVTLRGTVRSDRERWNMEDAVRLMPGVRGLTNETLVSVVEAPARNPDADIARPWFP